MLKMKFDDLLVSVVVAIVIFFNSLSTTMLNISSAILEQDQCFLYVLAIFISFTINWCPRICENWETQFFSLFLIDVLVNKCR